MNSINVEESLITKMSQGDSEAFRSLYLATSSMVFGYALSILKNRADAEDVMHDAYIRIYQSAATYKPMGKPLAWILTIVRNLCYNTIHSRRPAVDVEEHEMIALPDKMQGSLDRLMLERALELLDLQERQIVVLHALTGMKHREIAELLEMPLGTVLSKYHRSLERLKNELTEEEGMR